MKRHVDPLRLCLNVALNTDTLNGLFYRNLLLQKCINLEGAFSGDSKKKKTTCISITYPTSEALLGICSN